METLDQIAWALRKVRLPVGGQGLVLDVGAGNCPYPRADIVLERYVEGYHRGGVGVVADRPTVFADAVKMPFRDKVFDFVVASHVLEHVPEPEAFLKELMRVGKAGYIETPNIFLERLFPHSIHVLEVMEHDGKLLIRKKPTIGSEDYLARLHVAERHPRWRKLFYGHPQMFHVRYFWKDKIEYEIDNPDGDCSWGPLLEEGTGDIVDTYEGDSWRAVALRALRRYYAWRKKRSPVDWLSILACPHCHQPFQGKSGTFYSCTSCGRRNTAEPHLNFIEAVP
jgi:SAM-dependent methyltransferase